MNRESNHSIHQNAFRPDPKIPTPKFREMLGNHLLMINPGVFQSLPKIDPSQ
jgi:hypothetical protein